MRGLRRMMVLVMPMSIVLALTILVLTVLLLLAFVFATHLSSTSLMGVLDTYRNYTLHF